jgi:F0F1-type ATP synthase membrane subunit b/b'
VLEQTRKEYKKEIIQLNEEMEEIRTNANKKVRGELKINIPIKIEL